VRTARANVFVPGPVSEAEALWYDLRRWPAFVEGFAAVRREEGDWPRAGGVLVWDSRPEGRGRVVERVTRFEPRRGQIANVEDEQLTGRQEIAFRPAEGERPAEVELTLAYELKKGGPFMWLTDLAFIRRAQRDSLHRTLQHFARELEGDRALMAEHD
jgi:Polyketide cyclase / dehydrase and lipid transport